MGSFPNIGAFAAQAKKKLGGSMGPPAKPQVGTPPQTPEQAQVPADPVQAAAQVARMIAAGNIDQQVETLMKSYSPEDQIPAWAVDEDLWQQAEAAVQPNGQGSSLHAPWLNVALTYKLLGGKVQPQPAMGGDGMTPMGDTGDDAPVHPDDHGMGDDDDNDSMDFA